MKCESTSGYRRVSLNFEYFGYFMLAAFAQASTTFISQNYAAGNNRRCRQIFRVTLVLALLLSSAICIPLTIFRAWPTLPVLYLVYPVTWTITTILTCTSLFVLLRRQDAAAASQSV